MVQWITTLAGIAGAFYCIGIAHRLCLKGCQLWDGLRLLVFHFSPESWEGRKRMGVWPVDRGGSSEYIWLNACPCKKIKKQPTEDQINEGGENASFLCLAAFLCRDFLCLYLCPFLLCGAGAARQENLTHCVWTGWCHHWETWQLLEKHAYLLLIFEGISAAIAVAC